MIAPPIVEAHSDTALYRAAREIKRPISTISTVAQGVQPLIIATCICICMACTSVTAGTAYLIYRAEKARQSFLQADEHLREVQQGIETFRQKYGR